MRRRLVKATVGASLALGALLAGAGRAAAQTTTGNIRGFVREPSGTAVGAATVSARDVALNTTRGSTTTESGFYYLGGLRPGRYELSVRRIGFAPQTRAVTVQIGQTQDVDFVLSDTSVTLTTVTVVAEAAEAQTQTSEVGTNVTREQIKELPLRDRNFLDLAQLAPGVRSSSSPDGTRKTFSAGAGSPEAVNVFVDGASYKNDVLQGGVAGQDASPGNPFPQGAVQEFRVVTQNYKAEYAKSASAIITATTRTGSNRWEADGFLYNVGKGWVTKNDIDKRDNRDVSNFNRLQGGLSAGGPLVRDRVFFFGTFELNNRTSPQTVVLGSQAALAPPGLNPQNYVGTFDNEFKEKLFFGKLTYTPASRNTFEVSSTIRNENNFQGFGGQTSFQSAENIRNNVYTGIGSWRYAGERWLNELQISGQRYNWNPTPTTPGLIGQDFQNIIRIGGRDSEQDFVQNRLSLRNDVTRAGWQMAGEHVIKAGANVDWLDYKVTKFFTGNPIFRYRAADAYAFPFEAAFGFGDPTVQSNNTQFGIYAQDDWSVTPRLVLNLGIRWDAETNMFNNDYVTPQALRDSLVLLQDSFYVYRATPGQPAGTWDSIYVVDSLGGLDRYISNGRSSRPIYKKAFQPRLGASYDLFGDQRTVMFGGFGIYYDRDFWNMMIDERYRRQYKTVTVHFNATGPDAGCADCVAWDDRYLDPTELRTLIDTASAGLPEVFLLANDAKPPRTNQYSFGVRQTVGPTLVTLTYNGARGYNGFAFLLAGAGGPPSGFAPRLAPNYSNLIISSNEIRSWYNAGTLQIEKPIRSSRWGGSIAYTLAKAEQNGAYWFNIDDRYRLPNQFPRTAARPIFTDVSSDQRHTVVANAITRLPFDFLFSTLINLGSGYPKYGNDCPANCPNASRVDLFYPPTRPFLGFGHVFATQNVDVRLAKDFVFPGAQSVGLQLDVFNVFNATNFTDYESNNRSTNANFGRPYSAAEGRRFQIGLRYGFAQSSNTGISRSESATQ